MLAYAVLFAFYFVACFWIGRALCGPFFTVTKGD